MLDGFCVKEVQTAPEQSCKLPLRLFYILPTCLSTWIYLSIELSGCIFSPNLDVCWCVFFFFREKNCRARYLRLTRWRDDFIGESKSACAAHGSAPCWGLTSCNFHRIAPRFFFSPRFHLVELVESFFRFSSDVCLNCFCIEILWCAISKLM